MAPYNLAYIDNKKEKERVEIITNQSIKNLLGVFTANLSVVKCNLIRGYSTNDNSIGINALNLFTDPGNTVINTSQITLSSSSSTTISVSKKTKISISDGEINIVALSTTSSGSYIDGKIEIDSCSVTLKNGQGGNYEIIPSEQSLKIQNGNKFIEFCPQSSSTGALIGTNMPIHTSSTINCASINSLTTRAGTTAYFDVIAPNTISFTGQALTLTGGSLNISALASISIKGADVTISGSSSLSLKKGSYTYSLPNKSGTIALSSDVKLWMYTVEIDSGNCDNGGSFSAEFSIIVTSNFMTISTGSSKSISLTNFVFSLSAYNEKKSMRCAASGKIFNTNLSKDIGYITSFTLMEQGNGPFYGCKFDYVEAQGNDTSTITFMSVSSPMCMVYAHQII